MPNFDDVGIVGRINRIDHQARTAYGRFLKSDDEFTVAYNKLILAMGGQASLPPIKGAINLDYDGSKPVGEVAYYKGTSYDKAAHLEEALKNEGADIIGQKETIWDLPKHNWIHQPLVGNPGSNAYIMTFFTMLTAKLEK